MTTLKYKHSVLEHYSAFLKGYEAKRKSRSKNPYEKGSELYYFYSIGRKHKGEVNVSASRRKSYGHSDY